MFYNYQQTQQQHRKLTKEQENKRLKEVLESYQVKAIEERKSQRIDAYQQQQNELIAEGERRIQSALSKVPQNGPFMPLKMVDYEDRKRVGRLRMNELTILLELLHQGHDYPLENQYTVAEFMAMVQADMTFVAQFRASDLALMSVQKIDPGSPVVGSFGLVDSDPRYSRTKLANQQYKAVIKTAGPDVSYEPDLVIMPETATGEMGTGQMSATEKRIAEIEVERKEIRAKLAKLEGKENSPENGAFENQLLQALTPQSQATKRPNESPGTRSRIGFTRR